jgi:hypothetical protein
MKQHFTQSLPVSPTNKTVCHDITEILLKVALNAIKPNQTQKRLNKTMNIIKANADIPIIPPFVLTHLFC